MAKWTRGFLRLSEDFAQMLFVQPFKTCTTTIELWLTKINTFLFTTNSSYTRRLISRGALAVILFSKYYISKVDENPVFHYLREHQLLLFGFRVQIKISSRCSSLITETSLPFRPSRSPSAITTKSLRIAEIVPSLSLTSIPSEVGFDFTTEACVNKLVVLEYDSVSPIFGMDTIIILQYTATILRHSRVVVMRPV